LFWKEINYLSTIIQIVELLIKDYLQRIDVTEHIYDKKGYKIFIFSGVLAGSEIISNSFEETSIL